MNERLKELAVQAGMEWDTHTWCWLANPPHLERFAELVRQDYLRELKALKPVAWMYKGNFHDFDPSEWASPEFAVIPLYTAPPRKPWVSLSDDVVAMIEKTVVTRKQAIKMIEHHLKELNT